MRGILWEVGGGSKGHAVLAAAGGGGAQVRLRRGFLGRGTCRRLGPGVPSAGAFTWRTAQWRGWGAGAGDGRYFLAAAGLPADGRWRQQLASLYCCAACVTAPGGGVQTRGVVVMVVAV
eukprot:423741-Pelagomonas_calceolata.AAC.1